MNLISLVQAPLGPHLLRIEIHSKADSIQQMTDADFDDFLELVQLIKKQHQRAKQSLPEPKTEKQTQ